MPFDNGTFSKLYDWLGNKTDIPRKRGDSLNREFENFSDGLTDLKSEIDTLASVSTTEVGYLDGVTSPIQTQLDGKANLSGATFTGSVDLNAIAATKAVTAVDVFVYDTSKDSDGGAWRKRCQHTSWYNEELNTATRGSRREFPAVAVIVAESNKVTIYDGDDPALPMWHVEDYTGLTIRAISALDGNLVIGCATGMIVSRYVADDLGTTTLDYTTATTPAIVNNSVNDVTMTVLHNAPVDPATGLPVPTIAVATAGGVSVIKDDGTVVDIYPVAVPEHWKVEFIGEKLMMQGSYLDYSPWVVSIPDADVTGWTYDLFPTGITSEEYSSTGSNFPSGADLRLLGSTGQRNKPMAASGSSRYFCTASGLSIIAANPDAPEKGMVAHTTSTYNSGWLPGDIKGAFLADTDDTDLVGGTDADRSVNGNDLTVNGTVTRSAVATGAELVGYSGFSA